MVEPIYMHKLPKQLSYTLVYSAVALQASLLWYPTSTGKPSIEASYSCVYLYMVFVITSSLSQDVDIDFAGNLEYLWLLVELQNE